jgi:hypothetical protein
MHNDVTDGQHNPVGWRGSDFDYCINLLFFTNTYKKVCVLTKGK